MVALSSVRADRAVRVVEQPIRISLWAVLAAWLARRLWRLLLFICRSPTALVTIAVVTLAVLGWRLVSPALDVGVAGAVMVGLAFWGFYRPTSFDRQVRCRVRSWRRGGWVYRRRWTTAVDTARLTVTRHGTDYVPLLARVRSTHTVDRVSVRMLAGQTIDDYAAEADRLAQTFGAVACRVRSVPRRVHDADLWFLVRDPLVQLVDPLPVEDQALTVGLPVAVADDGTIWRLSLVGSHVLVVGATGAGKGSVIWSLLYQLAPSIRAGLVAVWAVDPKGGMELAAGQDLFTRFCHGDSDTAAGYETSFAVLLEDAVQVMRRRQDRLRGITRLHEPSTAEPLIVVIVDELAALTGWVTDRTAKRRIEAALGLLLSQGRAVGVVVVGAVQDPRKDVLPMRDLFPTRVALRLNEAEHVGLVLGPGARNRGAHADLIPDTMPGVGYVAVDGIAEPVRVRFSWVSDTDIAQLHTSEPPQLVLVEGGAAA